MGSNKNKGKFNIFSVETKVMIVVAVIFAVSLACIALKFLSRDRGERVPETYFKYSGQYSSEDKDFSEPLAETEKEPQERDKRVVKSIEDLVPISCWGDSFTVAFSDDQVSYAGVLAGQSQRIVYNVGSPGDSAKVVAGRQGGVPMLTTPFIIPPDKTPVEITIDSSMGGRLDLDFSKNAGLNPCNIAGVDGLISKIKDKMYFTRSSSGAEVIVYEPEVIVTRGMEYRKDDISVFFIGSDSSLDKPEQLVEVYKNMAAFLGDNDKYLVISPVKGSKEQLEKVEKLLEDEFGDKFLDSRELFVNDAFLEHDMYKLPPEAQEQAKTGNIPDVYFYEGDYLSEIGAYALGCAVNDKLKELGYYADADIPTGEEPTEETTIEQTIKDGNK